VERLGLAAAALAALAAHLLLLRIALQLVAVAG
jgi:hypothetical protein